MSVNLDQRPPLPPASSKSERGAIVTVPGDNTFSALLRLPSGAIHVLVVDRGTSGEWRLSGAVQDFIDLVGSTSCLWRYRVFALTGYVWGTMEIPPSKASAYFEAYLRRQWTEREWI